MYNISQGIKRNRWAFKKQWIYKYPLLCGYYAVRLLEKDKKISEKLKLNKSLESSINEIITQQDKGGKQLTI